MIKFILISFITCFAIFANGQKVGLVLSGGGALGFAHIGVLKALEENQIPIDYITGTSAGALIGSMYAVGWTPELMDSVVMSKKYQLMSNGGIETKYDNYYRKPEIDPSWINFKLSKDFALTKIIPTNLNNPVLLDFESMGLYSPVNSMVNYDFDQLFVPFRCVAADVTRKTPVIFDSGHLNQAVRASMTYPGYLKPIKIDGNLMFDGGLYNNFPTDIMYDEFFPDIIIGVNFSDSINTPDEDDVFSQLKSMILDREPSSVICDNGIMIEPAEPIGLFRFDEADKAIKAGYEATMLLMDSIKELIPTRKDPAKLREARINFQKDLKPIYFEAVSVEGVSDNVAKYIIKSLMKKSDNVDIITLKKRYFNLIADSKLKFIYPLAQLNPTTGKYQLLLSVYPEKPFSVKFGGVFSSKPINTGYIGAQYARLGKIGFTATGESYFGKYYSAAKVASKFDFNLNFPFSLEAYASLNRFDYFKSFTTFFQDAKPSYIIENERFAGIDAILPVSYFGKLRLGYSYGQTEYNYYQTTEFTSSDTSDQTNLLGSVINLEYSQSTLNRKQFASKGHELKIGSRYFFGTENTLPGSTSVLTFPTLDKQQSFLTIHIQGNQYFEVSNAIHLGLSAEFSALYTDDFLDNYTSTIIASPEFNPTPESRAMFIEDYSTHYFAAIGAHAIYNFTDNIEARLSGQVFLPLLPVQKNKYNQPFYSEERGEASLIGSGCLIYHSPIGPLSFCLNYYEARRNPVSFIIGFGYIIHNRRFLK